MTRRSPGRASTAPAPARSDARSARPLLCRLGCRGLPSLRIGFDVDDLSFHRCVSCSAATLLWLDAGVTRDTDPGDEDDARTQQMPPETDYSVIRPRRFCQERLLPQSREACFVQ